MSRSFTVERWTENYGMTPEGVVRMICEDPELSQVVGDSIAYRVSKGTAGEDPDERADWNIKATRYLLTCSVSRYARSIEDEKEGR